MHLCSGPCKLISKSVARQKQFQYCIAGLQSHHVSWEPPRTCFHFVRCWLLQITLHCIKFPYWVMVWQIFRVWIFRELFWSVCRTHPDLTHPVAAWSPLLSPICSLWETCLPAAASAGTTNLHSKGKIDNPGNLGKELKRNWCEAKIGQKMGLGRF